MCKFFSAILTRDENLISNPFTSSHEDLIDEANLIDNEFHQDKFIRLEFSPEKDADLACIEKYVLTVDENQIPDWFTEEVKERAINRLTNILNKIIIKDNRKILIGQVAILADGVIINKIIDSRILIMCGSSVVRRMYSSSVVQRMCNSSIVNEMYDSSIVQGMYDSSVVQRMYDSSIVQGMCDSSIVRRMYGSSVVQRMYDS